jgi:arginyl-tRNA synthetase
LNALCHKIIKHQKKPFRLLPYFCTMTLTATIKSLAIKTLADLYGRPFTETDFQLGITKPEFEGDYTLVLFSLVKSLRQGPEQLGKQIGEQLVHDHPAYFKQFNVIKGFLNLVLTDNCLNAFLKEALADKRFGHRKSSGRKVMVEYSSPNTNKPLHLGHLRNNFLGKSVAEILKADGAEVVKSCIVNDRGIHICKSMVAWQRFANGETPESSGMKGDHLVGKYYVQFNEALKKETDELVALGKTKEEAEKEAPIMEATRQMLVDWENGNPEVLALWRTMNGWVYAGFDATYQKIGSDFDITYYESDTYLLGKDIVGQGLEKQVFYRKDDGSVWIDLRAEGLDEKIVQRKDGTSVYITQDIGLAQQKYQQYRMDESIYVIGNEQNYHMQVLRLICQKLGMPNAENIHHLSYGMVELTTGKMKSREGTVVDADDLIDEMTATAKHHTEVLGKVNDFTHEQLDELYRVLGLGAMKFYLLRVDPKKTMVFNPAESIDFHGFTGPFIQYTYARIRSIGRKAEAEGIASGNPIGETALLPLEKQLLIELEQYPTLIGQAARELDPSVLAHYLYLLAKSFNTFYAGLSVLQADTEEKRNLRMAIATLTAHVLKDGMGLLGISVPERM